MTETIQIRPDGLPLWVSFVKESRTEFLSIRDGLSAKLSQLSVRHEWRGRYLYADKQAIAEALKQKTLTGEWPASDSAGTKGKR